jgi:hypothetical protein
MEMDLRKREGDQRTKRAGASKEKRRQNHEAPKNMVLKRKT